MLIVSTAAAQVVQVHQAFTFEVTANAPIMNLAETRANIWSANLPSPSP
jgi:hypothetical protein